MCRYFLSFIVLLMSSSCTANPSVQAFISTPVPKPQDQLCDPEAIVVPGQTVTDEISGTLPAHTDIVGVTTVISGETLTVVFQLRDLSESLTFNRPGVGESFLEYGWEVSVDVDNNLGTGPKGFEYTLSALYFVLPGASGKSTSVPIGEKVHGTIGKIDPDGAIYYRESAGIEVSAQANTIELSGTIPGISADSRLEFNSYDFLGGSDETGCHVPSNIVIWFRQCNGKEAAIFPGQAVESAASDKLSSHIDITRVITALAGETLTAVFHLRDVPEFLTFNRTGIEDNYVEYSWQVLIDVDTDLDIDPPGFNYILSASYSVHLGDSGNNDTLPIESMVEANIWKVDDLGYTIFDPATLEVSAEEETITLAGKVPGITSRSRVVFETFDFLDGSDEATCQTAE